MSDNHLGLRPNDDPGLSIDELAARHGLSVRTVRFYIAQGLLPGPGARGKSATYGEEHLVRLGLIRRLSDQHVPLSKIQALLQDLSLDEAKALLVAEEDRTVQLLEAERRQSPQDYVSALLDDARQARRRSTPSPQQPEPHALAAMDVERNLGEPSEKSSRLARVRADTDTWYRWTLAPGIELHVRANARTRYQQLIQRLLLVAGAQQHDAGDE